MKLFNRLNKLITADAHSVIDAIEDPYSLLKQSIRDMANIISDDEANLEQLHTTINRLNQQTAILETDLTKLNQDIELCLNSKNEILARNVIKKKLSIQQRIQLNQKNIQQSITTKEQLEKQLSSNQQDYQQLTHQAEVLLNQLAIQQKNNQLNHLEQNFSIISESDIEMALLNEKAKRETSK